MRKELLTSKRIRVIFWIILIAAAALRCIGFVSIPGGINQDEAMAGMDAWALSKYGTDRYGVFMPVHFTAWQYGQMSVLLSYCMIPFIKLFGFGTLAVRIPMLLASCGSVALVYLAGKHLFSQRFALLAMAMTAINPWHFMQSRWSLDCNLFPHVFLLAFYLLLIGLEKRKALYLSMLFFGLTLYCYGVAVYAVIPFLLGYAFWCLRRRQLCLKEVLLCGLVFTLVALPELLVLMINFFGWSTVETPLFTLSYFPESVRSNDILFLNFSVSQLIKNFVAMVNTAILQKPGAIYNALPDFGPMYYISVPFMLLGLVAYRKDLSREQDALRKARRTALWFFFLMGVWVGLVTYEVNVNRINIIFFPLIYFCSRGILAAVQKYRNLRYVAVAAYALCFELFLVSYFTDFADRVQTYFNVNFLSAVKTADEMEEYDRLYITSNADWQTNWRMTEILTQYACGIDAAYYQEKVLITGGRELLPYSQRYHFVDMSRLFQVDSSGLYLVHVTELEGLPFSYEVIETEGSYVLLHPMS
ncbi:MAG: glycosyltransferase family 39 protein [Acetatifactor sp.]|nr:glycosyltransferase family 39 protein [Acetatifactor sp.]